MPSALPRLLLCACLLSGCARQMTLSEAFRLPPLPPEARVPCPVQLLPERPLLRPEAEARIVGAEKRVADCDGRRALAVMWADQVAAAVEKLR